ADQSGDMNFNADDSLVHGVDKVPGTIAHRPRMWLSRFVGSCQAGHDATHHAFIVVDDDTAVSLGNHVVPSRQLLMELLLAGIPVWRDVGVASPKHHQDIIAISHVLPNRVGPRDMGVKNAKRASLFVQPEREVIGVEAIGVIRHQNPEWIAGNQLVEDFSALFFEMGWDIHGAPLRPQGEWCGGSLLVEPSSIYRGACTAAVAPCASPTNATTAPTT